MYRKVPTMSAVWRVLQVLCAMPRRTRREGGRDARSQVARITVE